MKSFLNLTLVFLLGLSILITSCSDDDDDGGLLTYAEIEAAFQQIEIKPGTQDLSLKISDDVSYNFRVIFPDVDLTQDLPMVLTLHGYAGGADNAHMQTDCYDVPGLAALDVIILSPNGGPLTWGDLFNQDKLRILTDLSSRLWPVDIDKIAIMGYSAGGVGAWLYSESQPATFSAGIAISSGYNILRPDGSARVIDIPMYVINGALDEIFPIDTISNWVDLTIQAGSDIEFVVVDTLGHYTPCDYVPYVQDAAAWLENEVWN